MPTKSAFASKGVWGGAIATFAGIVSFFHTVNITGLAQAVVDNWPALIAAFGGMLGAYGRIRASVFIAPKPTTGALSIIAAATLASGALALQSCALLGTGGTITTDEVTSLTAVAVSNGLQFGVKDSAQRATVAKEMVSISDIYVLYSNGTVPTPEQFQALLNKYIPAGDSKAITVSDITALYTLRYSSFKDFKLPDQIAYLTAFLNGVKQGASAFVVGQLGVPLQVIALDDTSRAHWRADGSPKVDKGDMRPVRDLILRIIGLA